MLGGSRVLIALIGGRGGVGWGKTCGVRRPRCVNVAAATICKKIESNSEKWAEWAVTYGGNGYVCEKPEQMMWRAPSPLRARSRIHRDRGRCLRAATARPYRRRCTRLLRGKEGQSICDSVGGQCRMGGRQATSPTLPSRTTLTLPLTPPYAPLDLDTPTPPTAVPVPNSTPLPKPTPLPQNP